MSTTLPGVRRYQRLAISNSLTKAIMDRLVLTVIVGLGIGAMGFTMGPMWLALEDVIAEMLDQFPPEILSIAGGADMATPSGWYTGEMYSIVVPFAVIFVAVSSAARAFGGEIENRTVGLVMATPTPRGRLAFDKVVAMVVHVVIAAGLVALLTWIGIVASDIDIPVANVLAISLMLSLLSIVVGGIAMVVSIWIGRAAPAILAGLLLALVMYAWSSFVPMADEIADLAWLSPWHHYIATDPMGSGVDWPSAALLAVLAVIPLGAGLYLFRRRDIPA